jgi:uncharacterized membrane-anchored protein YitT (DUF2179 family)
MSKSFRHRLIRSLPEPRAVLRGDRTAYAHAKRLLALRVTAARGLKDTVFITLGVLAAAFGLEGFLIPNGFLDGGATGVALLIVRLTGLSFPVLLMVINMPFLYMAFRWVGRAFALRSAISIVGLAVATTFIHFPEVTHDKLLVSVFGGFFLGAGIGLAVRGGSVLDGTEVLALALGRRIGVTIGDVIMVINVFIFGAAAYLIDVETALYAMITYLAASKTIDMVVEGIEEYTGITIISPHHEEIRHMIANTMGRGLTVYNGKRGYTKGAEANDVDILFCVLTRLEMGRYRPRWRRSTPTPSWCSAR